MIRQTQEQIESMKKRVASYKTADGFGVSDGENVLTTRYDDRIKNLEDKLDGLQLRFTDKHPDVIETKALLASLEKSRQAEIDEFLAEQSGEGEENNGQMNSQLSLEISKLQGTLASLQVKKQDLTTKIADLESKIDLVPQIEAELASLNRDYGITKSRYEELLSRRESADLSRRADVSAEEFQFRIIEPPLIPLNPAGPNRLVLYSLVLLVGFGAGIAMAFLVSQFSPVLLRGKQLLDMTDYPIWGTVTHLNIEHIRKVNRGRIVVFALSSGAIVLLYGGLMGAELMNINLPGLLS